MKTGLVVSPVNLTFHVGHEHSLVIRLLALLWIRLESHNEMASIAMDEAQGQQAAGIDRAWTRQVQCVGLEKPQLQFFQSLL